MFAFIAVKKPKKFCSFFEIKLKTDVCNQFFNGKTNKKFLDAGFFLPAINATVFKYFTGLYVLL